MHLPPPPPSASVPRPGSLGSPHGTVLCSCLIRRIRDGDLYESQTAASTSYFTNLHLMYQHKLLLSLAVGLLAALTLPSPAQTYGGEWRPRSGRPLERLNLGKVDGVFGDFIVASWLSQERVNYFFMNSRKTLSRVSCYSFRFAAHEDYVVRDGRIMVIAPSTHTHGTNAGQVHGHCIIISRFWGDLLPKWGHLFLAITVKKTMKQHKRLN